jgi:glycerophosphoryl diester phosphodiesterase
LVIAHRGASAYAPENTLAAFQLAAEQGADAIELDVDLTRDGHVVVMHDATIERTTNGHGRVHDLALDEIRQADAGVWKGVAFKGERVPLLQEVFEAVGQQLLINVEIKDMSLLGNGLGGARSRSGLIDASSSVIQSVRAAARERINRAGLGLILAPIYRFFRERGWPR